MMNCPKVVFQVLSMVIILVPILATAVLFTRPHYDLLRP